jgi:hypothetical protein
LAEVGIVRAERDNRPAAYERNEGYLEWQEASRIATELSIEAIIDRVEALEAQRTEYEAQFESTDPTAVNVFDHGNHETVHERTTGVSE